MEKVKGNHLLLFGILGLVFLVVIYYIMQGQAANVTSGGATGAVPAIPIATAMQYNLSSTAQADAFDLSKFQTLATLLQSHEQTQSQLDTSMATLAVQSEANKINAQNSIDLANIQANAALQGLQIQQQTQEYMGNIQQNMSNNATNVANNQISANKTTSIIGSILGSIPVIKGLFK